MRILPRVRTNDQSLSAHACTYCTKDFELSRAFSKCPAESNIFWESKWSYLVPFSVSPSDQGVLKHQQSIAFFGLVRLTRLFLVAAGL